MHQLITNYLSAVVGLKSDDIVLLQQIYRYVLFLDGYDLSQRYDSLWQKSENEMTSSWQISQLLVNVRVDYFLQREDYLKYFIPREVSKNSIITFYLQPLSRSQITSYLQAHTYYKEIWLIYLDQNPEGAVIFLDLMIKLKNDSREIRVFRRLFKEILLARFRINEYDYLL